MLFQKLLLPLLPVPLLLLLLLGIANQRAHKLQHKSSFPEFVSSGSSQR
jgi:hypothetical protein